MPLMACTVVMTRNIKAKDKTRGGQESHDRLVLRQAQLHAAQAVDGRLSLVSVWDAR